MSLGVKHMARRADMAEVHMAAVVELHMLAVVGIAQGS